jgi:hypothetical protein
MSNGSAERGIYLYAVAADTDAAALPRGPGGVDPAAELELVRDGDLVALCSEVELRLLEPDEEDEEDGLVWLERTARRHDEVLTRALAAEAVVPFRLGIVLGDRDGIRSLLRRDAAAFRDRLEQLRGAREWGVKAFADVDALAAAPGTNDADLARLTEEAQRQGGAAFFARKLLDRERDARVRERAAALAAEAHEALLPLAREAVLSPPQPREVSAYADEMILNASYLVDRAAEEALAERVAELGRRYETDGERLELTGPWPPYSFVTSGGENA